MMKTIPFDDVFEAGARILKGETRGRLVVAIPSTKAAMQPDRASSDSDKSQ